MKAIPDVKTVKDLLELRKANLLYANPEYQRGVVWTTSQKKKLVDSVFRGYPIPLIYLHHIKRMVAGISNEHFEVIDGQQRINALFEFHEGAFKLFHPVNDEEEARFPGFIKELPCPWGGLSFDDLDSKSAERFLETRLSVVMVETDEGNEARDLFIRLQAGMPLNSQEKRDAWPGNFTEFVLKTAGKPQLPKYPGHDFFTEIMKANLKNRGEYRQLCAQMAILFAHRRVHGGTGFCDINRDAIDTYYYKHLNFDLQSEDAKRFNNILTLLTRMLGDQKRKKIQSHEAIHLLLVVDALLDDYTPFWVDKFAAAFDEFRHRLAIDTKQRFEKQGEYWTRYGQFARTNSDRGDSIAQRHKFFSEKFYVALSPKLKDPVRVFGELEREIIYYRDRKHCQVCDGEVLWSDAEIHHVEEHWQGGATELSNGALVHKDCHPKGEKLTSDFAAKWKAKASQ